MFAFNSVWNDLNGNGVQDAGEPGLDGLQVRLLEKIDNAFVPVPEDASDGTAGQVVTTVDNGRATFTKVPYGPWFYIEIMNPPEGAVASPKNRGGNDQLDSELNGNFISDRFRLPSDSDELFDKVDCGLKNVPE